MQLDGRVALVTGGGEGIGRAAAVLLAREGARVAVLGRHRENLEPVVAQVERDGGLAMAVCADVADAAQMEAAREAEASEQMWSMIRTGGIAAGIALVVLVVWLRSRRRGDAEENYEPLELTDDMLAELDRIRIASTREEPVLDNRMAELEAAERQKVRTDISTMISERPDEVAAMLRGWLTESKS